MWQIYIHPFIIPVCCDHKSSLLLTICSEDTWENPHSLWTQPGDMDLIQRDQLPPKSLRTKSKTQITIDSNKKAPTHFPSGTNPKMQWKTVQLSWKIDYFIILIKKHSDIWLKGKWLNSVPVLKDMYLLFFYVDIFLCFRFVQKHLSGGFHSHLTPHTLLIT